MRTILATIIVATTLMTTMHAFAQQPEIPAGYWPESKSADVLKRVATIRLAPDLSTLTADEQAALKELLEVGAIMQKLDEIQKHPQARAAFDDLRNVHARSGNSRRTQNLLDLYRLWHGPIVTTLDNKREAFLPVSPELPGKNVYPTDATKQELEAFMAANPDRRDELLAERTVVRRETKRNLAADINALVVFPILRTLFPGLLEQLRSRQLPADGTRFYAVPYVIAWPDDLVETYNRLMIVVAAIEKRDPELARYLRHRGRDFLANDYEAGDASWVTGRYKRFNVQLGAYETYDDALFGVKAFHSMSILLQNEAATAELRKALGSLQEVENALPYQHQKRVRDDISVGVYSVIADFGQARGTNTATILPNDPLHSSRYGRTILLRENIMKHPEILDRDLRAFRAATVDAHANELAPEGNFLRTLWHEIGHYLGVERDKNGRTLDVALENYADSLEEMKSDLVSLFALHRMKHPSLRAIQASGIRRTLQNVKPRADQPYQTMQLVQFNWFLDQGLLTADPKTARLTIHYDKYPAAVNSLLRETLKLQREGDEAAAQAFFERWTKWTPELHEKLAERIRGAQGARWTIVRYAALGE